MALRGDSIDNIPGAPGIGDKGSVELIQQFGTVEAALDAAIATPDAIKRKTYRESLQNNRDNILLSKELVTIHTEVPIDFSVDDMRTQPVDNAACRELFSELEFTTLLKELAPAADNTAYDYNLKPTAAEIAALLATAQGTATGTAELDVHAGAGHCHLRRRSRHRRRNRRRARRRIPRSRARTAARRNHGPVRPAAVSPAPESGCPIHRSSSR